MAGNEQTEASKIFTLRVNPGIKRDGTQFEGDEYSEGKWARFQRGRAKKIGGYRQMFASPTAIARGMITNSQNGVNYVYTGNYRGIEVFNTGNDQGVGVGPFDVEFNKTYIITSVNSVASTIEVVGDQTTVFTAGKVFWAYNTSRVRTNYTVNGAPSSYNSGTNRTTVNLTSVAGLPNTPTSPTTYEIYLTQDLDPGEDYLWQFDIAFDSSGAGNSKLLAHPGKNLRNIDSSVLTTLYAGDFLPDPITGKYALTEVYDSTGANPTFMPVDASGGVVVLHPFVFVYSNYGQISNNNVDFTTATTSDQTFSDWNGPLANIVNTAAGKIVRGFPLRGGTASPSGLFWATDSLIRVSFTSTSPYYWKYDIVENQISIMSSNAVVNMDGIFFWMGVDRFYMYNGAVKVLPNDKNINYLFDNLNFSQRQKVWATKVPRFNEIWFFYPRGTATECTDAIIYNVKDQIWYDAGEAEGARRSCGYVTELFPRPIWAGWEFNGIIGETYSILYGPNNVSPVATNEYQVVVAGDITPNLPGTHMVFNESNSAAYTMINHVAAVEYVMDSSGGYTIVTFTDLVDPLVEPGDLLSQFTGGYSIWEHEFNKNKIINGSEYAVDSYVKTSDISFIGGTPAEDQTVTANRRMHITRIEPDFVQSGDMTLTVVGRPFAQGQEVQNGPYTFGPDTGKIDLRVENRLTSLLFRSNTINGHYEMGRVMITAELGDERP